MSSPTNILTALGFSESEIQTYLALLDFGPQTASEIAKHTELSRQTVYETTDALSLRALIRLGDRDGKKVFIAEHPEKLLHHAKRHEEDIRQNVKDLERLVPTLELQMAGERPVVRSYEGIQGVHVVMEENRTNRPAVVYEITDGIAMMKVLTDEDLKPYREEIKKSDTQLYAILSGVRRNIDPKIKTNRIYLPEKDGDFKSHIQIVGDTVTFVTFAGRMHTIVIENPFIAKAMRILFKYAFKGVLNSHPDCR
ncbi:MAG: helix-turn-helix domain-containing protein [Patescibacteria group bacterium]